MASDRVDIVFSIITQYDAILDDPATRERAQEHTAQEWEAKAGSAANAAIELLQARMLYSAEGELCKALEYARLAIVRERCD